MNQPFKGLMKLISIVLLIVAVLSAGCQKSKQTNSVSETKVVKQDNKKILN